jgi:hypothetical protein
MVAAEPRSVFARVGLLLAGAISLVYAGKRVTRPVDSVKVTIDCHRLYRNQVKGKNDPNVSPHETERTIK